MDAIPKLRVGLGTYRDPRPDAMSCTTCANDGNECCTRTLSICFGVFFLYNILFVYDGIVNAVFCHTYQRCMVSKSCANKHGPGFSAQPGTMCLVQLVPTMGMSIALVRFICDCLFVLMIENTNKYHS